MIILGIDPGLQHTGWGMLRVEGARLIYVADGRVDTDSKLSNAQRLDQIYMGLATAIETWNPATAAVEETFVNKNPVSTLKLGLARGVALLVPARYGLPVAEYPANLIKKSVVGAGHADKNQVAMMVARLLPGARMATPDAADALAVAICHAHHAQTRALIGGKMTGAAR